MGLDFDVGHILRPSGLWRGGDMWHILGARGGDMWHILGGTRRGAAKSPLVGLLGCPWGSPGPPPKTIKNLMFLRMEAKTVDSYTDFNDLREASGLRAKKH